MFDEQNATADFGKAIEIDPTLAKSALAAADSMLAGSISCGVCGVLMARLSGESSNTLLAALEELERDLAEDSQLFEPFPEA